MVGLLQPGGVDLNTPSRHIGYFNVAILDGEGLAEKQVSLPWIVIVALNRKFDIFAGIWNST